MKPHPEIYLAFEEKGVITAGTLTALPFMFEPKVLATADCEIELSTSEFDSKPLKVRLTASAAPQRILKDEIAMLKEATEVPKTLLQNTRLNGSSS